MTEKAVIPQVVAALSQHQHLLLSVTSQDVSLEQIYFKLQEQQHGGDQ
jgi:hypothetical protein